LTNIDFILTYKFSAFATAKKFIHFRFR